MKRLTKKIVGSVMLWAVIIAVLGVVVYRDVFFDKASAAETQILARSKTITTPVTSEEFGIKRAEIALQEYRKNVVEVDGCNCGPEIDIYTENHPMEWCTMFATWVTMRAGSSVSNGSVKNPSWRIVNSQDLAEYLDANGTWYSREEVQAQNLQPQIGDFIVYFRGNENRGLGHVDIVIATQGNGHADLIGGNVNDRIEYRENFDYQNNYGFMGFGRPEKA